MTGLTWFERVPEPARPPLSVVLIAGSLRGHPAYGCAVIIGATRTTLTLMTAAHILAMDKPAILTTARERLEIADVMPILGHDLAVITAPRPRGAFAVARIAPEPALGATVRLWGPVKHGPFTLQTGVVRAIDLRAGRVPDGAFAIDCPDCGYGDSGTGIFDERGDLLGIVTKGYFDGDTALFVLSERYLPGNAQTAALPPP